jgi:hypothetical protein
VKNRFIDENAAGRIDMFRSSIGYQWIRNRLTWHLAYEVTSWYRSIVTSETIGPGIGFNDIPSMMLEDVIFRPSIIVLGVGYVF